MTMWGWTICATDIIWTLANARTYRTLIIERGWTAEEYERWLGQLLASALLAESQT